MRAIRAFLERVAGAFGKRRRESDIDAELEAHIAMHVDDAVRAGMTPEEARRDALVRLGGLAQTRERIRERRSLPFLDTLAQDLRYAFRMLGRNPGFTAVAVATLALGIGANAAVFSVIDAVLLRPLPFPHPDRLVAFTDRQSLPDLDDIAARSRSFAAIAGVNVWYVDYTGGDLPRQIQAGRCTPRYFEVFGARAERGRLLTAADDHDLAAVAVLSHAFWADTLGGDPEAIGRSIPLSGRPYTVVGILPADARFPGSAADVFVPLRVAEPSGAAFRGVHFLDTALRLAPGVSMRAAQAEMGAIDRRLEQIAPDENRGRRRVLEPLRDHVVGDSRRALLVLFGAVGLVLLIACANFAGLLLARASVRRREMAIRGTLGAGSGRLVRQLLTESTLLAFLGGAAGLAVARFGMRALLALDPGRKTHLVPIRLNGAVFGFAAAIAAVTGILFGLVPALAASGADLNAGLHETARGSSSGRALHLRRFLVAAEIALALVLLTGAGLLLRSFRKLKEVDPGFRPDHVLTVRLELPAARYESKPQQRFFRSRLLESLNSLPGASAALVSELPMGGEDLTHNFGGIEGRLSFELGAEPEVVTRTVSPGYFRVMDIPVRRGRGFLESDGPEAPPVAMVNEALVRQYFRGSNPIGARVCWARDTPPRWMTIVGVVGDVRHYGPARPEQPAVYDLYVQTPVPWKRWMSVVVRSSAEPASLIRSVTQRIRALDRELPPTKIRTLTDVVSESTGPQKLNLSLVGVFAGLALVLASIGLYGLISYSVAQQRHDFGVRMALGADARSILRLVVGDGVRLAAIGAAFGLAGALAVTRVMTSLLFGVGARDPWTLAAVVAVLTAVAALASWVPARWATKVDPAVALRVE